MSETPFACLAQLGEMLEGTSKRHDMTRLVAEFLQGLSPEEIAPSVRLIIGQVFPAWDGRTLKVNWQTMMTVLGELTCAPQEVRDQISDQAVDGGDSVKLLLEQARCQPVIPPALTILEVFRTFEAVADIAGRGSRARKEAFLKELLQRSTPVEAKYLSKVIYREMRHGVSEGLMLNAIARAASVESALVRRANQLWGDLGELAQVALTEGETVLRQATIRLFRPLKPMLAQTAKDLTAAFEHSEGQVALEYKVDGARVQLHRLDQKVRIYSRNLADVTTSLADVVTAVNDNQTAEEFIVEGEVVAIDDQGRPLPFQHLMRRFRRKHDIDATIAEVPVQLHLFDALYVDGRSLLNTPYAKRWSVLERIAGDLNLVRRLIPRSLNEARSFADQSRRDGHEGIMAKSLSSEYSPGLRGRAWLKLKHITSLDLAIVAADWGYGRRHGWLSNYHLAALDEQTGELQVVGKTFKGLTDVEFSAMTEKLLALERSRKGSTVFVEPRIVVEVLFNEVQQSSHYDSGLALRFARIRHVRPDKTPSQADTMQTLRTLYEEQFKYKGRPS